MNAFLPLLVLLTVFQLTQAISVEKDLKITFEEKEVLDQFRERLAPLLRDGSVKSDDMYLIRWLRARNFNVDSAENMLKENLRWRRDNKMDTILLKPEAFLDIYREFPASLDTYDNQGRPIGVIYINNWDIRAAAIQGRSQKLLHYLDFLLEYVTNRVYELQAEGKNVTQFKILANCDGFNLIQHSCPLCVPVWIQFVNSLQSHYPGYLDELIAIDAPDAVFALLQIVRPFLSKNTREALRLFPPNRSKWMKYLDERISRTNRTVEFGGTKPPSPRY